MTMDTFGASPLSPAVPAFRGTGPARLQRDQDRPREPREDPLLVLRRGHEAGDDQLPDLQAGAGRPLLREDLRPDHRLGMPLRQVQADEAPGRRLRQVRRRGDEVQGPPRADGPHRARRARLARLVLQGPPEPDRPPPRPDAPRPRADPLLRGVRRHRPGPARRRGEHPREGPHHRGDVTASSRPSTAPTRSSRRWAPRRSRSSSARQHRRPRRRAPPHHEDRDLGAEAAQGRQAAQGRRRVPPLGPPARVDDPERHPGHPARAASPRSPRRRPVRDVRPQRPLPARHQPQQPPQEAPRAARARRSSSATRSGCSRRRSTPSSTTAAAAAS